MAPPIAFGIPFFLIYKHLDLIDTRGGLVVIYLTFNLSLVIWMMRAFFDGLPRSLDDALRALRGSEALVKLLGEPFVEAFTIVKEAEYEVFLQVISSWEREHLLLNV